MYQARKATRPLPHYAGIDTTRGFFVLCMVFYHTAFMLGFFFNKVILFNSIFFWKGMPIFISGGFLTLSGLSLYIATQRGKYNHLGALIRRCGSIFGLGMLLTLITSLVDVGGSIYFGILHCIGLATFFSFYLIKLPAYIHLFAGLSLLAIGVYGKPLTDYNTLFWLYPCYGLHIAPQLDYYPLIPHMGFTLLGIFIGKVYYVGGSPNFSTKRSFYHTVINVLAPVRFLGRHALLIYCLHTPIIFATLHLLNYFKII
jgi:uncharacterized membrane protein